MNETLTLTKEVISSAGKTGYSEILFPAFCVLMALGLSVVIWGVILHRRNRKAKNGGK